MYYSLKSGWGRAILIASLASLLIVISSCGSDGEIVSSVSSGQNSDSTSVSSAADEGTDRSDPIERLAGRYFIDGDNTAASVLINADGSFVAYYASGTAEQQGYVRYEADDSGYNVYVFYTDEGKPYMGFVDSGESRISEFETGNGSYRYARVD